MRLAVGRRWFLLHRKRQAFAPVEDAASDVERQQEQSEARNAEYDIQVIVDGAQRSVSDGWAEPDGGQRADCELDQLAAKRGQHERERLHLKDAGSELEELERRWRRQHRWNKYREELLPLETVSHSLVALAVDAL